MVAFNYGFDWRTKARKESADPGFQSEYDSDDSCALTKERLPDRTVRLPGGEVYTLGFQVGQYEYDGAKCCEAVVFPGADPDSDPEAKTVGVLELWLFDVAECENEEGFPFAPGGGLHMVADSISQELTDAMMGLLTPRGHPIGAFKQRAGASSALEYILYVGRVQVDTEHRGRLLGLVLLQQLVAALEDDFRLGSDNTMVLLCPGGDPPKQQSSAGREKSSRSLSAHFRKLGFEPCGTARSTGREQGMFMFCWLQKLLGSPSNCTRLGAGKALQVEGSSGAQVGSKRKAVDTLYAPEEADAPGGPDARP